MLHRQLIEEAKRAGAEFRLLPFGLKTQQPILLACLLACLLPLPTPPPPALALAVALFQAPKVSKCDSWTLHFCKQTKHLEHCTLAYMACEACFYWMCAALFRLFTRT